MIYTEKRGSHRKLLSNVNEGNILNYFTKFPESTMQECADKLGLCRSTVSKHLKQLTQRG